MQSFPAVCARYLDYCTHQKSLSADTLKAYRIDLKQFSSFLGTNQDLSRQPVSDYIAFLHKHFMPRTSKRKAASLKALCSWLEYEGELEHNPFDRLRFNFNEPRVLPRTIPLNTVENILSTTYQCSRVNGQIGPLRDIAILELLFATGVRVSELCRLTPRQVDLCNGNILILGKGSKERLIQIGNADVLTALQRYCAAFSDSITRSGWLFVNRLGHRYSEQSVRAMICKYLALCNCQQHITPHMFRHTFATQLLEADVDIRYIQALLGHSSISTTQIYTHVTSKKQMDILTTKHPRNHMTPNVG